MSDLVASPLVWIGVFSMVSVVVGIIFAAGQWKGRVDSDRDTFRTTLKEIRDDIKRIFERLPPRPPSPVLTGNSPLQLTDLGRSISATLEAPRWAAEIAPSLESRVRGMVAYDIQEFCRTYVYNEFQPTQDQEEKIKACAYDNALDRREVLDVLAIELRDVLLSP